MGIGGVLEVADESLGAGVGGGVLHGDLQALHGRAESLARGTAEEECGDVGVEEKSRTRTFLSGLARAASQAVWKAMKVLPTPPRLLQKHTECVGGMVGAAGRGVQEKMRPKRGRAFSGRSDGGGREGARGR